MGLEQVEGLDVPLIRQNLEMKPVSAKKLLASTGIKGSRINTVYEDDNYFPFYYYLGQQVQPRNVLQVGPYLGIPAMCFMKSCSTVEEWWAISERNTYIDGIFHCLCRGKARVTTHYVERFEHYKADMVFLSEFFEREKCDFYLSYLWERLKIGGLLVMDYISTSSAYKDFCELVQKPPLAFGTRYSVGILQK